MNKSEFMQTLDEAMAVAWEKARRQVAAKLSPDTQPYFEEGRTLFANVFKCGFMDGMTWQKKRSEAP